jgi:predicted peptidase
MPVALFFCFGKEKEMKQGRGLQWVLFALFALLAMFGGGCGGDSSSSSGSGNTTPTAGAIEGVTTVAFVDVDGPKVQAVVVEYDVELPRGSVNKDTYEVFTYANLPQEAVVDNSGTITESVNFPTYDTVVATAGIPGEVTKVYVSATPEIGAGNDSGKYVIIEVNTASQLKGVTSNWRPKLAGGVKQVKAINAGSFSVPSSATVHGNYEANVTINTNPQGVVTTTTLQTVTDDSSYVLKGLEGYKLYTDNPELTVASKVEDDSFVAQNCFSEYTGDTTEARLKYSLFVPADYQAQVNDGKKFALALHINDAGVLGNDPMIALTETNVAVNYAVLGQEIVKKDGLGGLIVVIPQVASPTVADDWTGNQDVMATWQLLDHITSTYEIDMDRIYGSGQSMGGMQVLYMASHRDNYFAGLWSIGSQWANNYDKAEVPFTSRGSSNLYSVYPTDGTYITNSDWQNWYYSLSDDNILITNMSGDGFATTLWKILKEYYEVKAHSAIPYTQWNPLTASRADQNIYLRTLLNQYSDGRGIYWNALAEGDHMATWIYAHAITASYEWLLTRTATSELNRGKLTLLNDPYADDLVGSGTQCLSTGTASGGPQMSGKAGLDYQPRLSQVAGCNGGPYYP